MVQTTGTNPGETKDMSSTDPSPVNISSAGSGGSSGNDGGSSNNPSIVSVQNIATSYNFEVNTSNMQAGYVIKINKVGGISNPVSQLSYDGAVGDGPYIFNLQSSLS